MLRQLLPWWAFSVIAFCQQSAVYAFLGSPLAQSAPLAGLCPLTMSSASSSYSRTTETPQNVQLKLKPHFTYLFDNGSIPGFGECKMYYHAQVPQGTDRKLVFEKEEFDRSKIFIEVEAMQEEEGESAKGAGKRERERVENTLVGLLLIGGRFFDEAHEVLQVTEGADAAYGHGLIHRIEGERMGELGLKGWSNAGYWFNEVGDHHPNYDRALQALRAIARETEVVHMDPGGGGKEQGGKESSVVGGGSSSSSSGGGGGGDSGNNDNERSALALSEDLRLRIKKLAEADKWSPSGFIDVCARAWRAGDGPAARLLRRVQEEEWRLLVKWILQNNDIVTELTNDEEEKDE